MLVLPAPRRPRDTVEGMAGAGPTGHEQARQPVPLLLFIARGDPPRGVSTAKSLRDWPTQAQRLSDVGISLPEPSYADPLRIGCPKANLS